MIMETNKKLIAVVEIGGDKAVQFWARADDLAQQYNGKSTDIVYTVVKLPDSDNLFRFFAASKEEMTQETLLECSREFLDELLTLVPSECVRIKIAEGKEE
ncbi:hypothetical protein DXA68_14620 [Bacteroides stercorirosoris]|jgi:hypothetical protein|uniref:Uncharacterized protein n=2 Tax=Bacteroides stercorirosoris TaxID=871324 RepID=A0A413H2G1_9BACE|nr:hypothetical protein DXA68_14620 [Bacteroides stercorirosoris]